MKKLLIILLSLSILQLSLISSLGPVGEKGITVQIQNDTITVSGYTIVQDPNGANIKVTSDNLFINRITNSTGISIIVDNVTVPIILNDTYNGTNETRIPGYRYNVNYLIDIPFTSQNITNQSSLFCVSQSQYETCLADKLAFNAGLNSCVADKKTMTDTSSNFTNCQKDLQTSQTSLQICNSDKGNANNKIADMEKKQKDTSNQIWFVGIGALVGGSALTYFLTNKGIKMRDPENNFNRTQAG